MGQRFTIERKLAPSTLAAFDRFIAARRPTIDEAQRWLEKRGEAGIPRSCIYGYMADQREKNALRSEELRPHFRRISSRIARLESAVLKLTKAIKNR